MFRVGCVLLLGFPTWAITIAAKVVNSSQRCSDRPPLTDQKFGPSQKAVKSFHKFTSISYTRGKAAKAESEVSCPQHGKNRASQF